MEGCGVPGGEASLFGIGGGEGGEGGRVVVQVLAGLAEREAERNAIAGRKIAPGQQRLQQLAIRLVKRLCPQVGQAAPGIAAGGGEVERPAIS